MFIDTSYLLAFGLPISSEIDYNKIERAIATAENIVIKPRLGDLYAEIVENPLDYDIAINGGVLVDEATEKHIYVAGLKMAEAHIAFGILLGDVINATTFGAVLKDDEYSTHADEDKLRRVAMTHTEIGMQYLKEITDYYQIKTSCKILPNVWEEHI